MTCYHPITGFSARICNPKTGKRSIVFDRKQGYSDRPMTIPCGQCIGCRLERSRQWAIRCLHEAQLHEQNCFLTLTFDAEHLPASLSIDVRDFQLFMKRLRKKYGAGIRFYHCGEYGDASGRPHYHACIFNHDFDDKIHWKTINENKLYISESLSELWPFGFSSIGDVTFESAAYVARYIMKKITGDFADQHYEFIDQYGEIHQRKPEYTTMSRRPGLGQGWLEKWRSDVYPSDEIIINGHPVRPPKYYDLQMEAAHSKQFRKVKRSRIAESKKHLHDQTPARLAVREKVQNAKLQRLPRKEI